MANHTITTDTHIQDISDWNDNDNIIVKEGATLTVENQGNGLEIWKIGYIKVEFGHLQIENTTQDGLELLFNSYVCIDIKDEGTLTVNGKLVKIHTSDGTSGQTFKFWDESYEYQITGLFVDGEYGMLMDEFLGLPNFKDRNDFANSNIRLHKYDKDNAEFKFEDYYIPADGTDIFTPNILIKRVGTNDAGAQSGYIRYERAKNIHFKGAFLYCNFLSGMAEDVSYTDCVLSYTSYIANVTNLSLSNCLSSSTSTGGYGIYIRWCKNVVMNNITYYGKADMEANINMTFTNWYTFNVMCKDGNIGFRDGNDLTISNVTLAYSELGTIKWYDKFRLNNLNFIFDDDYSLGYSALIRTEHAKNGLIENIFVCDDFVRNRDFFKFTFESERIHIKNCWFDIYHCNEQENYVSLFVIAGSSHDIMFYNCGWTNSKEKDYQRNYIYQDAYNNTLCNVDVRNQAVYLMGKNNSFKNLAFKTLYAANMYGNPNGIITLNDSNGDADKTYFYAFGGIDDKNNIYLSNTDMTTTGSGVYFKNDGDFVIYKQTKEQSDLRRLKKVTDIYLSGNGTSNMDLYMSVDKGQTWISDIVDYEFQGDHEEIWLKVVNTKDRDNHADGFLRYARLELEIDTNKPDYEPYFIWTKIDYSNLPEPMYGSFYVSGQDLQLFETQNAEYTLYELWKENPNNAITKIRKYGYIFYENQAIFNDESLEFFYTGYLREDLTMSRDDALAVSGVVLQSSSDGDYTWELDCGSNSLEAVYHYIQAKLSYHNTDLADMNSFELNEFLQRDGKKFKTIQARDGEGVKLINYDVKEATRFQKDDGSFYEIPLHVDIEASNLISGTRVQIFNISKDTEIDNITTVSSGYVKTIIIGDEAEIGDEIRLRACYQRETTAKLPIYATGIVSETGLIFIDSQISDDLHNALGFDGSTIDADNDTDNGVVKADFDNTTIEIDANDDNIFDCRKGIAWYRYICTTEQGIRVFNPEALSYNPDTRNMLIRGSLLIKNTKDDTLTITGGVWKKDDNSSLISTNSKTIVWIPNDRIYDCNSNSSNISHQINNKTTEIMNKLNEIKQNDDENTDEIISTTGYKFAQLS